MADLLGRVRETIERHRMLEPGGGVVVAVSGGPDSVALAHLLLNLAGEYRLALHVAHLNHRLRGAEAEEEAGFVAQLAASWGLPCTVEAADVPGYVARRGGSVEDAARRLRYAFLARVAAATGASRVALGHQADDVAETVLMNLLRGAGVRGLSGIPPVRGRYVRPLIDLTRAEILEYLGGQGLPYRLDLSNASPRFFRNRIRHELLPYLERDFAPKARVFLSRAAALLRAEDEYLEEVAARWRMELERAASGRPAGPGGRARPAERPVFDCAELAALPEAILRRIIRQVWSDLVDEEEAGERQLGFERVEAVADLARRGRTGARLELPGGVRVRRRYGELVWSRQGSRAHRAGEPAGPPGGPVELQVPGETLVLKGTLRIRAGERQLRDAAEAERLLLEVRAAGRFTAALDAERLEPPLVVRRRRPGDRFWPLGAPGEKRLKDHLIDLKRPPEERDGLFLLADRGGQRPVWLIGDRPAEPVRLSPATRRALVLEADQPPEDQPEESQPEL